MTPAEKRSVLDTIVGALVAVLGLAVFAFAAWKDARWTMVAGVVVAVLGAFWADRTRTKEAVTFIVGIGVDLLPGGRRRTDPPAPPVPPPGDPGV